MTREYWAVKLAGGSWLAEEGTRRRIKGERRKCTRREALRLAADFEMESKVVHVTRKPKAPPPLAVGETFGPCHLLTVMDARTVGGAIRNILEDMVGASVTIRIERVKP